MAGWVKGEWDDLWSTVKGWFSGGSGGKGVADMGGGVAVATSNANNVNLGTIGVDIAGWVEGAINSIDDWLDDNIKLDVSGDGVDLGTLAVKIGGFEADIDFVAMYQAINEKFTTGMLTTAELPGVEAKGEEIGRKAMELLIRGIKRMFSGGGGEGGGMSSAPGGQRAGGGAETAGLHQILGSFVKGMFNGAGDVFSEQIAPELQKMADNITDGIQEWWGGLGDKISGAFGGGGGKGFADMGGGDMVATSMQSMSNSIGETLETVGQDIVDSLQAMWDTVTGWVSNFSWDIDWPDFDWPDPPSLDSIPDWIKDPIKWAMDQSSAGEEFSTGQMSRDARLENFYRDKGRSPTAAQSDISNPKVKPSFDPNLIPSLGAKSGALKQITIPPVDFAGFKASLGAWNNETRMGTASVESQFRGLSPNVQAQLTALSQTASTGGSAVRTNLSNSLTGLDTDVGGKFASVATGVFSGMETAKSAASLGGFGVKSALSTSLIGVDTDVSGKFINVGAGVTMGMETAKMAASLGGFGVKGALNTSLIGLDTDVSGKFINVGIGVTSGMETAKMAASIGGAGIKTALSTSLAGLDIDARAKLATLGSGVTSGMETAKAAASIGGAGIKGAISTSLDGLGAMVEPKGRAAGGAFGGAIGPGIRAKYGDVGSAAGYTIGSATLQTVKAILGGQAIGRAFGTAVGTSIRAQTSTVSGAVGALISAGTGRSASASGGGRVVGAAFGTGMAGGVRSQSGSVGSAAGALISAAVGRSGSAAGGGRVIGAALGNGIAAGIRGALGSVISAATNIVNAAISAAKSAGAVASPSRRMRDEVGLMLGLGQAQGQLNAIPQIEKAAKRALDASFITGYVPANYASPVQPRASATGTGASSAVTPLGAGSAYTSGTSAAPQHYQDNRSYTVRLDVSNLQELQTAKDFFDNLEDDRQHVMGRDGA